MNSKNKYFFVPSFITIKVNGTIKKVFKKTRVMQPG